MPRTKYKYDEKRGEYRTKVWDGTYTPTGKKHLKNISSKKSSADLEKKVAAFKKDVEENLNTRYGDYTFSEYANIWFETNKAARETNTKAMYSNVIVKHFADIAEKPLTEVTHTDFQLLINKQLKHPRTCQQIYITFRQVIKSAVRDRLLPKSAFEDICMDISLPKYKKPEKRPLTALERDCIFKVDLDDRKSAFLYIIYYCGLRRAEALALTKSDFDFNNRTLNISNVIVFDKEVAELKPYPKSDNGLRTIPMPEQLINRIKPFVLSSDGFIFKNTTSDTITKSGYDKMWRSIIVAINKAAGWPGKGEKPINDLTAHVFRHNYCTELCYKVPEISTKMIAKLLGDDERMVLEVYSHIVEEKENPTEVLDDIFSN